MDRRGFFQTAGSAIAAAPLAMAQRPAQPAAAPAPRKTKMHVGTQHSHQDEVLSVLSSLGVNHICSTDLGTQLDESWTVDGLSKLREKVEKHGISLDMVPLPLPSAAIGKAPMGSIMLGKSPERDRQIDDLPADDPQLRAGGHSGGEVQHDASWAWCGPEPTTGPRASAAYSTFRYVKAQAGAGS